MIPRLGDGNNDDEVEHHADGGGLENDSPSRGRKQARIIREELYIV